MNQPVLWSSLLALVVVGALVRWLVVRRPFVAGRARAVDPVSFGVAVLASLALVFHCTAMFFTPWVLAVPGTSGAVAAVNALGTASEWAYWVPAVLLVVALRRVWWPPLAVLTAALGGVGVTMFYGYALDTHLAWLTAVILVGLVVFTGFVAVGTRPRQPGTPARSARGEPSAA